MFSTSGHSGGPAVAAQQHCSLMLCLNTLVPFLKYHFTFIHAAMWTAFSRLLIHITTVAVSMVKAVVCCFCYLKSFVCSTAQRSHMSHSQHRPFYL